MKKHFKIFVVAAIVVCLIAAFSISCFADSTNGIFYSGDLVTFKDTLDFTFSSGSIDFDFTAFMPDGNEQSFNRIVITYRGYFVMTYDALSGGAVINSLEVYNDGWVNDSYKTILFDQDVFFTGNDFAFFAVNTFTGSMSYYETIYNIIVDNVYGDMPLNSDMQLTVSLISTILSILVILLPIIAGIVIFVWIMRRF